MVQTVHAVLPGQEEAAAAISRLIALGVSHEAIRTFSAADAAHAGSFADSGDHAHTPERDHAGSFADSGDHAHTPERDHAGSFADVDGSSVAERTFVSALVALGLVRAEAEAAARAIAAEGVLVLARVEPGQAEAVTAALKQ